MYSMLMMTSLAAGPDVTEFNGFFRNLFSFRGGCAGSCGGSGSGYGSCTGRNSARAGCTGNYPPRLSSSCLGRASASCQGSNYYSSCSGSDMSSSYDMPAMTPYYAPSAPCDSCPPATSGIPGGGTLPPTYSEPPTTAPFARPRPAVPGAVVPPADIDENRARRVAFASPTSDRATVVVKLPADARLYAQGRELQLTSDRREFVTPPLPPGEFGYTFRAEYVRGGETVSQSKQVAIRPGQTFAVEFVDLVAARGMPAVPPVPAPPSIPPAAAMPSVLAADLARKPTPIAAVTPTPAKAAPATPAVGERARITLKLPAGATLYVDGKKHDRVDAVRQFDTPPVPVGQTFTYAVRVEVVRNGRPESQSEQVTVRAGEVTTRDFTNWTTVNAAAGGERVSR